MEATAAMLKAIREGNEAVVDQLYSENRERFLSWAGRHYPLEEAALLDIYQDAVIILYQNVVEEKITELRSTLSTYLFGIAKNLILKAMRQQKRTPLQLDQLPEVAVAPKYLADNEPSDLQQQIRSALNQLGKACRQILEFYYYYDFNLEVIAERLNYKNANTVKAQKHRCMKQMEERLKGGGS